MSSILGRSLVLCAGVAALALAGCGGSSTSTSATSVVTNRSSQNYVGTQAPGDVWNWTLGAASFSAANTTKGISYSGSSSLLPSGYNKLTVETSTDPSAPVGSVAYAFDVPGVAFIAQPAGSVTNPIVGAASGINPTGTTHYNWITIPDASWNDTSEAYGTAAITMADATTGTIDITQYDITGAVLGTHPQSVTFSGGEFTTDHSTGAVTPAGVIMVDNGPGEGGVFGVMAPAANIDLTDLASQEYRGIVFLGGSGSDHTELIKVVPSGSGGLDCVAYTNAEIDTVDDATHHVLLSFGAQNSPGLVNGTIQMHSASGGIVLAINRIGGKYMIYGFAKASDGTPDNFLLIEK